MQSPLNLGDCYDAMYHVWNPISLLAAGVPLCHVKLMLIALQTIGWHLKFGSDDRPMMGLGQGRLRLCLVAWVMCTLLGLESFYF